MDVNMNEIEIMTNIEDRHTLPVSVIDTLLHLKDTDRTEKIVLPYTRYANVMNAPKLVQHTNQILGAPFALLETDTEFLTRTQLRNLCGPIL